MAKKLRFDAADVEVRAKIDEGGTLTVCIFKEGTCVYQIAVDDATRPMEHSWIADLFAREDRIALASLAYEADDYLNSLDIKQG